MNANKLAEKLAQSGYKPVKVSEPSFEEDGAIHISERVHVQVPLDSEFGPNVVRETMEGHFAFDHPRRVFDDLIQDLRQALQEEATEQHSNTKSKQRRPAQLR